MKFSNLVKSAVPAAVLGLVALGLTPTSAAAQADPATTTFGVSATVVKDCIVSATALGFGNYTGAVNNATSAVTVTCTNGTTYSVGLDAGKATGATVTTRSMQLSTTPTVPALNYTLTSGSGTGPNWGNSTGAWVTGSGSGAGQALTVYGQIAAGQYVAPGTYNDTITVTVTY
jgi:spore coat protein U-like protein